MNVFTWLRDRTTRPKDDWQKVWGHSFKITSDHLSDAECERLCESFDELGANALDRLYAIAASDSSGDRAADKPLSGKPQCPARDLFTLLEKHAGEDAVLTRLWQQVNTTPDWVDWAQLKRGQDVFYRYGGANLAGLLLQSMMEGMTAPRVAETLARTGGFSPKIVKARLDETTQWVLECTRSIESIRPGGQGWTDTVRIRLLHSAVRKRLLDLATSRPAYYSVKDFGIPIHDFHCLGTISTFSSTLIDRSLPAQGVFLSAREKEDYVALWRYLGHLIGCPVTPYYSTAAKAKAVGESVMLRELTTPSKTSRLLAHNMIEAYVGRAPVYLTRGFLVAYVRWLNGNEMADALELGRPSLLDRLTVAGTMLYIASCAYGFQITHHYDQRHVVFLKARLWRVIVESDFGLKGQRASFDFKHVPTLELPAESSAGAHDRTTTAYVADKQRAFRRRILLISALALSVTVPALGLLTWVGIKTSLSVYRSCVRLLG